MKKTILFLIAVVLIIGVQLIVPLLATAQNEEILYVDAGASGKEDGSSDHPYNKISEAIDKAGKKTTIIVKNGTYEENIKVPEHVKVIGKDKKKTIIKAKHKSYATVIMKADSELQNVTVSGGKYGIKIEDKSEGEIDIVNCYVKKANDDGINIDKGHKDAKSIVNIINTNIYNNGRSGIYSDSRRLVIMDGKIYENHSDGIDLAEDVKAYIGNNSIFENRGVGIKMRVDDSEIVVRKNDIIKNKKDGIEVRAENEIGDITIKRNKIGDNGGYGIAKVLDYDGLGGIAKYIFIENTNYYWNNVQGNESQLIKL